jgi:hypothetical protein
VRGVGTTSFQLESGDTIHIQDVLYVPGLKKNLLSTSTLEDKGYRVAFMNGQVLVWPKGSSIDSASDWCSRGRSIQIVGMTNPGIGT